MMTLNIIGCGRVGRTLGRLFRQSGLCRVQDLHARDAGRGEQAAAFIGEGRVVDSLSAMRPASMWMLTVSDTAIAGVAAELAAGPDDDTRPGDRAPVVFHCSGFWPAAALAPLLARGWHGASVHPVRSFADPAIAAEAFDGTPCGLEGARVAVDRLEPLFQAIGGQCFRVASDRKVLYHAAAVFASNFTVVLQSLAHEAWRDAGVPETLAWQIQSSLVRGTIDNVFQLGPAAAITGPAARGDEAVVRRQGEEVAGWNPAAAQLYRDMSLLARRLAVGQSTRAEKRESSSARARHLRISGLVQGVGYRYSMVIEARRLGVDGWVRNRVDGTVEAHIEGETVRCDALEAWARRGPPSARVDRIVAEDRAVEGYRGFESRATV